jgi:hypothetical protein
MTLYMNKWPIETAIDAGFEKEFPELAARIKRCGLGVYKTKEKRGSRGDMLGFPTWWLSHFSFQISGFTQDKPDLPYTRELLVKRVDKVLKAFRKEQRAYKTMTPEDRINAVSAQLEKNWEWAARNGHTYNSFINAYMPGGDCATRLRDSAGVWLWGIGQVCAVELRGTDWMHVPERLLEAYRAKVAA